MWSLFAALGIQSVPILPGMPGMPPFPYTQAQTCDGTQRSSGSHGVLDVRLGEPLADTLARSTFRFRTLYDGSSIRITGDRLDLRFRDGERTLDLPGIGGMHNTILQVSERPGEGVTLVQFHYQGRPLALVEALDRAWQLRQWFGEGGFVALPSPASIRDSRGFQTTSAPNAFARPEDRAATEALLRDETRSIPEMQLFRLANGRDEVGVTLENWPRLTWAMTRGGASIFDACNGREWGLVVSLYRDTLNR